MVAGFYCVVNPLRVGKCKGRGELLPAPTPAIAIAEGFPRVATLDLYRLSSALHL